MESNFFWERANEQEGETERSPPWWRDGLLCCPKIPISLDMSSRVSLMPGQVHFAKITNPFPSYCYFQSCFMLHEKRSAQLSNWNKPGHQMAQIWCCDCCFFFFFTENRIESFLKVKVMTNKIIRGEGNILPAQTLPSSSRTFVLCELKTHLKKKSNGKAVWLFFFLSIVR